MATAAGPPPGDQSPAQIEGVPVHLANLFHQLPLPVDESGNLQPAELKNTIEAQKNIIIEILKNNERLTTWVNNQGQFTQRIADQVQALVAHGTSMQDAMKQLFENQKKLHEEQSTQQREERARSGQKVRGVLMRLCGLDNTGDSRKRGPRWKK